jgi:beta-phosphoglucomutase family hydrolase
VDRWLDVADLLVDGFDAGTKLYEQHAGFFALEDVPVLDLARRPYAGDVVLGRDRLRRSQLVKQADVLMLPVLLPETVPPDVARANYGYYEPRTSHGSSLSPPAHAIAAVRAGALVDAERYIRMTAAIDLADEMGSAALGLHFAALGGLWQAAVLGFGGVRASDEALHLDPNVPPGWGTLAFVVHWHGVRVKVRAHADGVQLTVDGNVPIALGDQMPVALGRGRFTVRRDRARWSQPEPAPALSDAVIFDMDGVVTDTASVHARAWKQLFDQYLGARAAATGEPFRPFDIEADYLRYIDGKLRPDGVRSFLGGRGIALPEGDPADGPGAETVHGLGNRKDEYFRSTLAREGVRRFDSTIDLIRDLRERGVRTGLVTASRNSGPVLSAAGVRELFDVVVDGVVATEQQLPGKPDPATYLEAAARLGVEPERAAVVEDARAGVEAGRRGGFGLVVGVDRGGQRRALEAAGADVVVNDLSEWKPLL